MRVFSKTHTDTTEIESMKLKEPLDNKLLQAIKGLMVLLFVNVPGGLHVLMCVWCPLFDYANLNLKFKDLE